ncbi:MAG: toll/interleukin-1 receptor domain-containing protein, partial [Anaerolineales bacterium]|nr:toll/interleukin-1 receptor domain-containing protein [Anaerolineales bacterium]
MQNLFISYSREDDELAQRLQQDLEAQGYTTWVDTDRLRAGQRWTQAIEGAIKSSDVLLVIWSQTSLRSRFVEKECLFADRHGVPIIPLLADATPLPVYLEGIQYLDLSAGNYQDGLASL